MDKKRPVKKFHGGRIQVAIWENRGKRGTWFSVTCSRSYRDEMGDWRDSNGFAPHDLPLLCRLLDQAYDCLDALPRSPGGEDHVDEGISGDDAPPESWNGVEPESA